MAKVNDKKVKQFQNFFGLGTSKVAQGSTQIVVPAKINKSAPTSEPVVEKFPNHVQELFSQWMSKTYTGGGCWEDRKDLNNDMMEMYLNDSIISYAIDLVCNEVLGSVENRGNPIGIEAKRSLKKDIVSLFDDTGIKSKLPLIVKNVVLTGNSGVVLDLDENGVSSVQLVESDDIVDRLEFNASDVQKQLNRGNSSLNKMQNIQRSDMMLQSIKNSGETSSFYKTYLLGFQINDLLLPPWRFIHFKTESAFSAFKPFGTPMYIHALAPSKQFQYAMTLMSIARGLSFPVNKFTLTIGDKMHPTEKLSATMELMNQLQNSGMGTVKKEKEGLGQTMYTVEGLYDYESVESNIDLGNMGDIEILREDRVISTHIPRDLIDPSDSGFGDSSTALKEKFKPFGNLIFNIQTVILEGLDLLVKIHLIQSGKYEKIEDLNYTLSLPFPRVLQNDDLISQKGDLLSLANDVIDAFGEKLLGGAEVPPDIAMEIYKQFFPVDDNNLEDLYKQAVKMNPVEDEAKEEITERYKNSYKLLEKNVGKTRSKLTEAITVLTTEAKTENCRNGVMHSSHYFTSSNKNLDFSADKLNEWKIEIAKKVLHESTPVYNKIDEVKYVFESEEENEEYGVEEIKSDSEYGIDA